MWRKQERLLEEKDKWKILCTIDIMPIQFTICRKPLNYFPLEMDGIWRGFHRVGFAIDIQ
jgi:hypothetical protein